jgi:hypothetical protein
MKRLSERNVVLRRLAQSVTLGAGLVLRRFPFHQFALFIKMMTERAICQLMGLIMGVMVKGRHGPGQRLKEFKRGKACLGLFGQNHRRSR